MYYINCFFIYSVFGNFFERVVGYFRKTSFDSGILYGPWTPIYGIGADIILLLSRYFFRVLHIEKWREIVIVFFIVMVVLTFIEWLGGILIEKFFHIVFWNYEEFQYHIGKYIAVEVSLLWGFLSLLLIYGIHPFIHSFIVIIPSYVTYVLMSFMVVDYVFTIRKYLK